MHQLMHVVLFKTGLASCVVFLSLFMRVSLGVCTVLLYVRVVGLTLCGS